MIRISGYIISLLLSLYGIDVIAKHDTHTFYTSGGSREDGGDIAELVSLYSQDKSSAFQDSIEYEDITEMDSLRLIERQDPGYRYIEGEKDTTWFPGIRIGVNIVRPLMVFPVSSRFGIEGVADFNLGTEYFAVVEGGYSKREYNEPDFNIRESGLFLRLGADKNYYTHFNDVVGLGVRLGFSVFDRKAPFAYVESGYWSDYSGHISSEIFFSQWAEVVAVLKTEVFPNIYMGWNIRGRLLLYNPSDKYVKDRYIPGFGPGDTNSSIGFDFYLYYRIPTRK